MLNILGQHGWVDRSTQKSLMLIYSSLCTGVCTNVLYVSFYHRLIRNYVSLNRRYHWLSVRNSDRYSLPAYECGRPSLLGRIVRIIMNLSPQTSVTNPT